MRKKAFIAIGLLLIFSSVSWAATCPSLNPLSSVTGVGDFQPTRVATGDAGVTYVSDYANNNVTAYAKDGSFLGKLSIKRPSGIAVDSSKNIYIGSSKEKKTFNTGGVTVYNPDFKELHDLGSGWGEFKYPTDLEVFDGKVYVVDSEDNVVKIFSEADGSLIKVFGGYGRNDGNLVRPTAIAADPQTGNVYVADSKLQYDTASKLWGMGAGLHVFTGDGVYVRNLPIYFNASLGAGSQKVYSPAGLHVDAAGNVYLTDTSAGKMLIFDATDTHACDFSFGTANHFPTGIAEGSDGRLLVVTQAEVRAYATERFVEMAVSPSQLALDAQECVTLTPGSVVYVTNKGTGTLDWSATADVPWIKLTPADGNINGKSSVNISIDANAKELAAGSSHEGVVTFTSQGDVKTVKVALAKAIAPTLSVAESALSFEVKGDVLPASQALNIVLDGDTSGLINWTATSDAAWAGVSPSSGSGGLSVAQAGVNSSGLSSLSSGVHSGQITISTACPQIAAQTVAVDLNYMKGGTIKVSSNIDEASYTITGPETYNGAGKDFLLEVVPAGTYTIAYDAVSGFMSPASYSLTVAENETVTFSANYTDLRENNRIVATPMKKGYQLSMFDGSGNASGAFDVAQGGDSGFNAVSQTASGDIDGDGVDEIVVAHDGGIVTAYEADGTQVAGINFYAFGIRSNVALAVADLDGDGRAEILAAPGSGNGDSTDIRAFGFDGTTTYDTGMIFSAYKKRWGVKMASGDMDGDGAVEFVTTRGGDIAATRNVVVRVFEADLTAGPGAWKGSEVITFEGGITYGGVSVASADMDADNVAEIVVATVPEKKAGETEVSIYNVSGDKLGSFMVSGTGLNIAAGDVDYDGSSEIVVSGADSSGVRVYGSDGALRAEFTAIEGASGVNISLGQIVGQ